MYMPATNPNEVQTVPEAWYYQPMATLTITIDEQTARHLWQMAQERGIDPSVMASRLLRRAVRAVQPRPVYDVEALRAYVVENMAEELALADSDSEHRAQLLAYEDQA